MDFKQNFQSENDSMGIPSRCLVAKFKTENLNMNDFLRLYINDKSSGRAKATC